jgi:hypothetical protein
VCNNDPVKRQKNSLDEVSWRSADTFSPSPKSTAYGRGESRVTPWPHVNAAGFVAVKKHGGGDTGKRLLVMMRTVHGSFSRQPSGWCERSTAHDSEWEANEGQRENTAKMAHAVNEMDIS